MGSTCEPRNRAGLVVSFFGFLLHPFSSVLAPSPRSPVGHRAAFSPSWPSPSTEVIRVISAIFLRETLEAANNDAEMLVQEQLRKRIATEAPPIHLVACLDSTNCGLRNPNGKGQRVTTSKTCQNLLVFVWLMPSNAHIWLWYFRS